MPNDGINDRNLKCFGLMWQTNMLRRLQLKKWFACNSWPFSAGHFLITILSFILHYILQEYIARFHENNILWKQRCCYSTKSFILLCTENCCWLGAVVCKQNKLQNSRTFQAVEKCVSQCRSLANNFTKSCSNFMKCCKYQQ